MLQSRTQDMFPVEPVVAIWSSLSSLNTVSPRRESVRVVAPLRLVPAVAPPASDAELRSWFAREVLPLDQMLLRFLRRNWRNASEIEDLKQDAYARVWEAARRERPTRTKPFLFLVLRNLMIDRLRQKRLVCIDFVGDLDRLDVSDGSPSPERHVAARQELRLLQASLDGLAPLTRQILILRKVEGHPQRQVANLLGLTEEAVEHQLAKAIRQIKAAVARRQQPRVRHRSACSNTANQNGKIGVEFSALKLTALEY
jgi:RNA polymerase sigma factor (sigma-70 family)